MFKILKEISKFITFLREIKTSDNTFFATSEVSNLKSLIGREGNNPRLHLNLKIRNTEFYTINIFLKEKLRIVSTDRKNPPKNFIIPIPLQLINENIDLELMNKIQDYDDQELLLILGKNLIDENFISHFDCSVDEIIELLEDLKSKISENEGE